MSHNEAIYITDTNVLFDLLQGHAGFQNERRRDSNLKDRLSQLFSGKYRVFVPLHAFLEMAEQFFQINIDLDNYLVWYRMRKIVFNTVLLHPIQTKPKITLMREIPGSFYAANRIMTPIHPCYRSILVEDMERKKTKKPGARQQPDKRGLKFLDGMDAAILEEAIYVAQQHPDNKCYLITSDRGLFLATRNLREAFPGRPHDAPENLYAMGPWAFLARKKRKRALGHSQE